MPATSDEFTLYDLRVEVVACRGSMVCNHRIGDYFELSGENLSLPAGQTFPIYPLAALLPLLPAKQRKTLDDHGHGSRLPGSALRSDLSHLADRGKGLPPRCRVGSAFGFG